MPVTFYAEDNEFAAASGDNIDVTPSYSYFDHPPSSTRDLTITSNAGDDEPFQFDVGETYDLTWSGHGGGIIEDAVIIRSDYLDPGQAPSSLREQTRSPAKPSRWSGRRDSTSSNGIGTMAVDPRAQTPSGRATKTAPRPARWPVTLRAPSSTHRPGPHRLSNCNPATL